MSKEDKYLIGTLKNIATRLSDDPDCDFIRKAAWRIGELLSELAEADRRAGAAERRLEYAEDAIRCHRDGNRRKKAELGYPDSVSMDRVWDNLIAESNRLNELERKINE